MAYNETLIQQVWEKGRGSDERDSGEWRQDECGAWLRRDAYGQESSDYGWRIVNTSPGGAEVIENLHPLHVDNSYDRANDRAHCQVSADRTGLQPTATVDHPRNKVV